MIYPLKDPLVNDYIPQTMPSPMVPMLMILFISSNFLLFSLPNIVAKDTSSLIKEACSYTQQNFDSKLCIEILQSQKKIVSATNFFELAIGIIELGISNSTDTRTYIENMLKKPNTQLNLKGVLQKCKRSYDSVIESLKSALIEVKSNKDYETATYDLLIASTDNIEVCQNGVALGKIEDKIILSGNKVVPIFGLSACEAVESLLDKSETPPPGLSA